jgi:type VI secretion system secreted protein VgrG
VRGITDRWLVPEAGTPANPFAGIDRFLGEDGYRRLGTFDLSVRPGKQKIVVYATVQPDGDIRQLTAAALQHPDGRWSCKVGSLALIEVPHSESLRGPDYGLALTVYERDVNVAPGAIGRR